MHIYTSRNISHVTICIYIKLKVSSYCILIHYHMDHSSFLTWLVCKFHPNSESPGFHHTLSSHSVIQFQCACSSIGLVRPYFSGKDFKVQCLGTLPFPLVVEIPLISTITWVSTFSSQPLQ